MSGDLGDDGGREGIPDQAIENLIPLWLFTLVLNVVAVWMAVPQLSRSIRTQTWHDPTALLIPLGLVALLLTIYRTRRAVKFGESWLWLHGPSPVVGGNLSGTIQVSRAVVSDRPIQLRLLCILRRGNIGSRKNTPRDSVIWKQSMTVEEIPERTNRTDIPVRFSIPENAHPTGALNPTQSLAWPQEIIWRLEARRRCGGIGYFSRFEIPILAAGSDQSLPAADQPIAAPPINYSGPKTEAGVTCQALAGGLQIHLAAGRRKPVAPLVVGLALTALAVGIFFSFTPDLFGAVELAAGAVCLLIGGLFDYIAAYNLLVSQSIAVHQGYVVASRHSIFFDWEKTYEVGDIAEIICKSDGDSSVQSGSGPAREVRYYGIQLKTREPKSIWIANNITHQELAAWLTAEINRIIGIGVATPT